jgi:hypothetical protein
MGKWLRVHSFTVEDIGLSPRHQSERRCEALEGAVRYANYQLDCHQEPSYSSASAWITNELPIYRQRTLRTKVQPIR